MYFVDEHDWWAWEWSQGSRFWVEGMSSEGLERFQTVSFKHLEAMKGPKGIPILDGALFAVANTPPASDQGICTMATAVETWV